MKVTSVEYSQLRSTGNFGNEKVGLVIELEDGDDAQQALTMAKRFVLTNFGVEPKELMPTPEQLRFAKAIVEVNPGLPDDDFDDDDDVL